MRPTRGARTRLVAAAVFTVATALGSVSVFATPQTAADASLPGAWAHWRVVAPVRVDAADAGAFVAVVPPSGILAAAQRDWSDIRVLDDMGAEQPFVVRVRASGPAIAWRTARVFDPGSVPNAYSQATIDTGVIGGVHNRVRISLAPIAEDFLTWMEVSVSGDAKSWAVVRDRMPIYQLSHAGVGISFEASYPDSLQRYVRVRILDGSRRYVVTGAAVAEQIAATRELADAPVTFVPGSPAADRSVWLSTPAAPGLAVGEIRFDVASDAAFDRAVAVEASDDGRMWVHIASGSIGRRVSGGASQAQLVLPVSWQPIEAAAYWRVTIYNGSDRPLTGLQIHAMEIPRRIVFRAGANHRYRILAGNPRATAPSYDLARTVDAATLDAAHDAAVGGVSDNANYADPAPWTDRHPWVLWAAAILAVAAIGLLAMRTMRGGTE